MPSHQQRHHPQDFRTRSAPYPDNFGPARLWHHLPHATAGRPRSTSEATSRPRSSPEALERIVARDRARREAEYAIEYELSRNYHRRWGGGGGGLRQRRRQRGRLRLRGQRVLGVLWRHTQLPGYDDGGRRVSTAASRRSHRSANGRAATAVRSAHGRATARTATVVRRSPR